MDELQPINRPISADITLDVKPEHIKEMCNGFGKDRDLDNILNSDERLLLSDALTDEERKVVLLCRNDVIKSRIEAKNTSLVILSTGAVLIAIFFGGGYFLRQMKSRA